MFKLYTYSFAELQGALWMPNDGVVTAPDVVSTFARKAKQQGTCPKFDFLGRLNFSFSEAVSKYAVILSLH